MTTVMPDPTVAFGATGRPMHPDTHAGMRRLGETVRATRKARGLSQERLGELSGCDRQSINRIENGQHAPLVDRVFDIARALGVPVAELFGRPERSGGE